MPHKPISSTGEIWKKSFCAATLTALCWAVYGQSLGFGYLPFDDYEIYTNPFIISGLSREGVIHFFSHYEGPNWFPLNWLSHMAVFQLFGPAPWAGHLVNIILHMCSSLLLFLFLHRATGRIWPSWLAAGLFAAHPLHAESVAWISERKDTLSAFFFMLTLLAYLGYTRRKGVLRYCAVFLLLFLGLMAKSMLVTLPCVFLLLDFWPLSRMRNPKDFLRLLPEKIPFFLLSLIFCLIAFYGAKQVGTIGETGEHQLLSNLTNALVSYAVYLKRLFAPFDLAFFYPHPGSALPLWKGALAFSFIIALSAFFFFQRRKHPYVLMGWLWFLGVLVPVIGIVQPGLQGMADRYAYLPFIGVYIALAWCAADAVQHLKFRPQWKIAAACIVLVLLAARAREQAGTWRNAETLATSAIANTQNNYVAHMLLMGVYGKKGLKEKAKEQYRLVCDINPYYVSLYHEKHAQEEMAKGAYAEALNHSRRAYAVNPTAVSAYNLGFTLERMGQRDEAGEMMRKALELDPALHQASEALQRLKLAPTIRPNVLLQTQVRFPERAMNTAKRILAESQKTRGQSASGKEILLGTLLQIFETRAIPSRLESKNGLYVLSFRGPGNKQITWNFRMQDKALIYKSGARNNVELSADELGTLYGMLLRLGD